MKKYIYLFLVLVCTSTYASNYTLDEVALDKDFSDLNKIEEKVLSSNFDPKVINEITATSTINLITSEPFSGSSANEFYVDWKSFAWGFCCCPVGFFTVAVSNNADYDMKTSYWIGVAANVCLNGISAIFIILANGTSGCYY